MKFADYKLFHQAGRLFFCLILLLGVLLFGYFYGFSAGVNFLSTRAFTPDVLVQKESVGLTEANVCEFNPERCEPVKTYTSKQLGLLFSVHKSAEVIESGNKILVGGQVGQSVEVLNKPAAEDILQTIVRLDGSLDNCVVQTDGDYFINLGKKENYPDGYKSVIILPADGDWERSEPDCRSNFVALGGMRYYLYDIHHPEKILRINIGQYSIPAGKDLDWQYTLRFE